MVCERAKNYHIQFTWKQKGRVSGKPLCFKVILQTGGGAKKLPQVDAVKTDKRTSGLQLLITHLQVLLDCGTYS